MRTGIIYGYTNLESDKMYIGQTLHPERRWNEHRYCKNPTGWHKDYQNNPEKYEYSVIEYDVPEDKLDEREIFWISFFDSYNNGYNLTEGGHSVRGYKYTDEVKQKISESLKGENNPMYGKHLSDEAKKKISDANKKHWQDPEYLKKMQNRPKQCGDKNGMYGDHRFAGENNPMYGKKHSEETRKKMREHHADVSGENHPMYGKKHSEETRKKMREHHADVSGENNPFYGKKHSEETRKKMSDAIKGMHFYNNGIVQIRSFECPIGFTKGRLKNKK